MLFNKKEIAHKQFSPLEKVKTITSDFYFSVNCSVFADEVICVWWKQFFFFKLSISFIFSAVEIILIQYHLKSVSQHSNFVNVFIHFDFQSQWCDDLHDINGVDEKSLKS